MTGLQSGYVQTEATKPLKSHFYKGRKALKKSKFLTADSKYKFLTDTKNRSMTQTAIPAHNHLVITLHYKSKVVEQRAKKYM